MKHIYDVSRKGVVDSAIILIIGFMSVCIYRMFTTKPRISCTEFQNALNSEHKPSGRDIKDHFYHGH